MIESHDEALAAIKKHYPDFNLSLKPYGSERTIIEDGYTLYEDGKFRHVDEKGGEYTDFDFIDPASVIYKLVVFPEASVQSKEKLIHFMKNEEMRDVKEWAEFDQKISNERIVFYKLVPFTVQGVPTYS